MMIDLETRARAAADSVRHSVEALEVPPPPAASHRSGRRAVVAAVLLVVGAVIAIGALRGDRIDSDVVTSTPSDGLVPPPSGPPPLQPAGTELIRGTTATGQQWHLMLGGGPGGDMAPCLYVRVDATIVTGVCGCGPGGQPSPDPLRPLVLADQRAPHFVAGQAPNDAHIVRVSLTDGTHVEATRSDRTVVGALDESVYYAAELPGDTLPIEVRFFDANGRDLGTRVVE